MGKTLTRVAMQKLGDLAGDNAHIKDL